MEAENGRLRRTVIRQTSDTNEARSTCDCHDMALVVTKHIWQERFGGIPVAEHIYIEDLPEIHVGCGENGVRS